METTEIKVDKHAKISALVSAGLDNNAIWAAIEQTFPEVIEDDNQRAKICDRNYVQFCQFNKAERDLLSKTISQVRYIFNNENDDIDILMNDDSSQVQSPNEIEYINRSRFSSNNEGIDYIYGETKFRWLHDCPYGKFKKGDYKPVNPCENNWIANASDCYTEKGMPDAFLSLWGGEPGVGKTRLAVKLCKLINYSGLKTLYYNGEVDPMDFRSSYIGLDVNNDLFKVVSGEMIKTEKAIEQIYTEKPKLVVFDSIQMLSDASKGTKGIKKVLSQFKVLKSDNAAGRPHIIFISQLNKKNELAGSRYFEHMVDFAARITKVPDSDNKFSIDCPRKNRGGSTPRGAIFQHTDNDINLIECF